MILSILYFILILGIIVLVHEFGHFFFAKLFGVYVYEFSIGMGPKIFGKKSKNGETEYCIRAIPIGGFVQLAGEGGEEDENIPKKRLLQSKPAWQRLLIMFFGAGNNFILTIILLFSLGLFVGCLSNTNVVQSIVPESPAEIAGINSGDYIINVDGNKISNLDDLQLYLTIATNKVTEERKKDLEDIGNVEVKEETKSQKYSFEVTVKRGEETKKLVVEPLDEATAEKLGYTVGIGFDSKVSHGFFASIKYAFTKTGSLIKQMFMTIKELFKGSIGVKNLSGPVGILRTVNDTKSNGFVNLVYLLALLSLNVGFINLLPFPAFDGGRILFLGIEKIIGKPIKPEVENTINNIGFFLLLGLVALVTLGDIRTWIGK